MRVVPPLTITDAMLTASSAPEPGVGETAWNAATAYTVGQQVYLASNHTRYERLIAGTTPTSPALDPTNWFELGPTNRWAMFDLLRSSGTVYASPLIVTLTPGQRLDAFAALGLIADSITVTVTSSGMVVYTSTTNLSTREVVNWYDYFFAPFTSRAGVALFDLPPITNAVVTITITRSPGSVTCGSLLIGSSIYLGRTLHNAVYEGLNFSKFTRDEFGNSELIQRRTVPKVSFTLRCAKANVTKVTNVIELLNAVPALWSGIDDQDSGYFEPLLILGIYKTLSVNMDQPEEALVNGELEEN